VISIVEMNQPEMLRWIKLGTCANPKTTEPIVATGGPSLEQRVMAMVEEVNAVCGAK
jgi:hypothetical protein